MTRAILSYNKKLIPRARKLRKALTFGEVRLWSILKRKQFCGYDFHRQKSIDNYIVDFFCPDLMLAIEVDGSSHNEDKHEYDIKRQQKLESFGITFLRFSEYDVKHNLDSVTQTLEVWLEFHNSA